jgi:hypothetical protein
VNAVLLSFAGILAALAIHLAVWRFHVPRRATRALAAIFGVGLLCILLIGWRWLAEFGWAQCIYVVALYGAAGLTYLLTYTAIEGDSPTLSLAVYIAQGGSAGRSAAELGDFIAARPFVMSRLAQLEQGGFVVRRGDRLELAERSTLVLDAGEFYRRLMGRRTRGG